MDRRSGGKFTHEAEEVLLLTARYEHFFKRILRGFVGGGALMVGFGVCLQTDWESPNAFLVENGFSKSISSLAMVSCVW